MKVRYWTKRGEIWLDFKDASGKRHRPPSGCKTQAEAERVAPSIIARVLSEGPTSGKVSGVVKDVKVPKRVGMTLREAFTKGMKERSSWVTSKDKESKHNDFKGLTTGNNLLTEDMDCSLMTRDLMIDLRAHWLTQPGLRKGSTMSHSTINHRLTMASVLLQVAGCPPHLVEFLSVKNTRRKRRVPDEELQAVVTWCIANHHRKGALTMADLILTGRYSLQRITDLLTLKWADVYLSKKVAIMRDPKNGEAHTLFLMPTVMAILERRRNNGEDGPFTDLGYPQAHALWRSARAALGLQDDQEFVFHVATRHEGLTALSEAGNSSFMMKGLSGHQSLAAVDNYVHPSVASMASMAVGFDPMAQTPKPTTEIFPDAGGVH